MKRSIGYVVAETANRLISTADPRPRSKSEVVDSGDEWERAVDRDVGLALQNSEVLGFESAEENDRARNTQGLILRLGTYEAAAFAVLQDPDAKLHAEVGVSFTLGGFATRGGARAVEIRAERMDREGGEAEWLPARGEVRSVLTSPNRLDSAVHCDENWRTFRKECKVRGIDTGLATILLRRMRYRASVDHAKLRMGVAADSIVLWCSPHTEYWLGERKDAFRYIVMDIVGRGVDYGMSSADDWGDINPVVDKLRVATIGPNSASASTHMDVNHVLERAKKGARQLAVKSQNPKVSERATGSLAAYAKAIRKVDADVDIVMVYRGGGEPVSAASDRNRRDLDDLRAAIEELTKKGVEVIVGLGHGDFRLWEDRAALPAGVYEALTPTDAAIWLVQEHVNTRLAQRIAADLYFGN